MRKMATAFCLVVSLMVAPTVAHADDHPLISTGAGFVGAYGPNDPASYGFGGLAEGLFHINGHFAVGLRAEAAVLFSGKMDTGSQDVSVGMRTQVGYLLKGEFRLFDAWITPMVGLGAGYYTFGGTAASGSGATIDAGRNFGVAPQLGINLGSFRLAAMYHVVFGEADVTVSAAATGPAPDPLSRNYVGIELSGSTAIF